MASTGDEIYQTQDKELTQGLKGHKVNVLTEEQKKAVHEKAAEIGFPSPDGVLPTISR